MSEVIWKALVFVLGAAIGSFINVVALRYGTNKSWVWNRSACPHCQQQLRWWELLPIISFIVLGGRCSRCRAAIDPRYFFVEVLCGVITVAIFSPLPRTPNELLLCLCISAIANVLVLLSLVDAKTFLLPDHYLVVLSLLTAIVIWVQPATWQTTIVWGAVLGSGFLFVLWLSTRGRGIGLGDVKLMVPVGALLGPAGVVVLFFIAFCVGGLLGAVLLVRGKATMKTAIPFGPFLAGAAIILLLFPQLTAHFLSLLLLS